MEKRTFFAFLSFLLCFLFPGESFAALHVPTGDYYVVILTHARGLQYDNVKALCDSIAGHSGAGGYRGDVGHAWIYLKGSIEGKPIVIEGGHSGELGQAAPRYLEGIMQNLERGSPNPVSYLWATLPDGFFQRGSGGHRPSYAAYFSLTQEQFKKILAFLEEYRFDQYALTERQCTSFAARVIELVTGVSLECAVVLPIDPTLLYRDYFIRLWSDPVYGQICFPTPDKLEQRLRELVASGGATDVLFWYLYRHKIRGQLNDQ